MLETKLFEVRDRGTFIPCIGIRMLGKSEEEKYLLARAGYSQALNVLTLFGRIDDCILQYNPQLQDSKTRRVAHGFVEHNWDSLVSGQVVDIEYILGEIQEPKKSERLG